MGKTYNKSEAGLGEYGNLRRLAYFTSVVETGSFTAAADRLGITKAVVSQQVARLEKEFRTSLLVRTTRKVTPTEAGQAFYQRCAAIMSEAENAFGELAEAAAEPAGTLRLTAPFAYGINVVVPAINAFTRSFPKCKVEAVISDHEVDLISGNYELAIRAGWLTDSSLQARQMRNYRQLLVAPSTMKSEVERLTRPGDIAELPFVAHSALRNPLHWNFSLNEIERQNVSVQATVFLDTTLAVHESVRLGAGLSVLPDYVVAEDLKAGRLLQVMPQWALPSAGIYAVFPSARFRPAKVRAFVEVLLDEEERRYSKNFRQLA